MKNSIIRAMLIACCLFSSATQSSAVRDKLVFVPSNKKIRYEKNFVNHAGGYKGYLNLKRGAYQKNCVVNKFEDLESFEREADIKNYLKSLPAEKQVKILTTFAATLNQKDQEKLVLDIIISWKPSRLQSNKVLVTS